MAMCDKSGNGNNPGHKTFLHQPCPHAHGLSNLTVLPLDRGANKADDTQDASPLLGLSINKLNPVQTELTSQLWAFILSSTPLLFTSGPEINSIVCGI